MKRSVLVVDDNIDVLMIFREILDAHGFAVETAQSGREALERLERGQPSVVLLDIMMPEMSGLEVLERIRTNQATVDLPVIMVTAKVQDEDLVTGYRHGADYYITKPCTPAQLLYGINLMLGNRDSQVGEAGRETGRKSAPRIDE